jgi:hypothetical protein
MMIAGLQDGVFQGYFSVDEAEGFLLKMAWLEMLYRLSDGRWLHVLEEPPEPVEVLTGRLLTEPQALALLATRGEYNHFPELQEKPWFRPYVNKLLPLAVTEEQASPDSQPTELATALPDLSKEELAKALLLRDPAMTNAELARRLNLHPSTVGRWGWVARFREMLADARRERPRGFRTEDGRVEVEDWRSVMADEELDRYDRGELE